uniref:Potassium two pore domain channel subfamily K member 17 n=1 Tax=Apteryx owenii TaxID=8824 RepID=A0A8B9PKV6_APTOW
MSRGPVKSSYMMSHTGFRASHNLRPYQPALGIAGTQTCCKVFFGSHVIVSLQGIIQAYKSGITLEGNSTSLGRWDFSGSFFFSISTITTIGYGNLSPSTAAGRIFCIFFALFGIPLNLVLLNSIGQLMLSGLQHCAHRLEEKFHWQKKATLLIRICALLTCLLLFLLLPPVLFSAKEGWSYEEGFYYSFITLSTIGFGDYVIGMNPDRAYPGWYKNVISLWILFGMAWLALVIKFCINLLESSSDFCQCNKKSKELVEDLTDGNKNSMTGLDDVESCSGKDTKQKDQTECPEGLWGFFSFFRTEIQMAGFFLEIN